jgi:hypothetical protein
VKVTVQSSSMITRIFNELGNVDETVMRFWIKLVIFYINLF